MSARAAGKGENKAKVLIVEDSHVQAELLRDTLLHHGFTPLVAENGKRALEMIGAVQPDAIISDVLMPVMDGYEFCRAVKKDDRYWHIPVILLTMLTDTQDVICAMESGADNFITKPYKEEYIISRLNSILEQGAKWHPPADDEKPVEIVLAGKTYTVRHGRRQIIEFLLSSYEAAVIQHQEVLSAQGKLAEANEEANLYLDIITHDINNVNTSALALTELLLMKSTDADKAFVMRLIGSINQSCEIIGNVSTIRRLHERKEAIRIIDLDDVINNEIRHFSTNPIRYDGTTARVLADTLVGQIFTNLIGNSVKFAGTGAEIAISVRDAGAMVEVAVSDNGPGIPDDMKPAIFDRFKKGKSTKTGKGLGLFISRMLVEIYGGKIWAEDRVPGHPDQGAAIHFTLRKAAGSSGTK
jgi:signal transduction histidine kinase